MGQKYMIYCSKYPYKGSIDKYYQTKYFIKALFLLVIAIAMPKYEIIDFKIRK